MFLAGSAHITFHAPVIHDTWLLKLLKMAYASLDSIPKVVLSISWYCFSYQKKYYQENMKTK